jgi:curved DNA-binding protein CbpA
MSSASAGKFQDHYEVLGVDHKAGTDAIQSAYARLSDKYNPQTGSAPDHDKFEAVTLAFEVLSDPDLRGDFDKLKGIGADDKPRFSGRAFFDAYTRDVHLRVALLCVLYDRRRTKPFTPSLSMRNLENIFNVTTVEMNFAIWYMKQRDLVVMDDKSSLMITTPGMDYLRDNPPNPDNVMKLLKEQSPAEQAEAAPAAEGIGELAQAVAAEEPARPMPAVNSSAVSRIGSVLANRKR